MARQQKQGLEYFPMDVFLDQNAELFEAEHGISGMGFWVKLLQKIYSESYYIKWDNDSIMLFSRKINVDINTVNVYINTLFCRHLLDKCKHEKYGILTSRGIQKRYIEATQRRKEVTFITEYLLIENVVEKYKKEVNVNINPLNVDINSKKDDSGTQSKVEESKSKVKVEESRVDTICPEPCQATDSPQVISLTLNDKSEFPIFQNQIDEWSELYPAVDVLQELRGMRGWLSTNPQKRKTKTGILRFVNAWLAREQNKGGAQVRGSPAVKSDGEALAAAMRRFGV